MVLTFGEEPDPAKRIRKKQGALIVQYRGFRGLTQEQLALRFDPPITDAAISQWENGHTTPRQHHQVELCSILDVPWSAIFGLDR